MRPMDVAADKNVAEDKVDAVTPKEMAHEMSLK